MVRIKIRGNEAGREAVMTRHSLISWEEVEREYLRRTPRSRELHAASKKYLPGGDTRSATFFEPYPIYMARGKGFNLYDVDGNEYIDFLNNYTSLIHGHCHPQILAAVFEQLDRGTAHGAPTPEQHELAQLICERIPSLERLRFCNSGSEATSFAIKAARAYTGREKIVKMEGGYHGGHDAVEVSVTSDLAELGPEISPKSVLENRGIPSRVKAETLVAPFNNVEVTEKIIQRNRDQLAAVIVEPVLGAGGMIPARKQYLEFLREITRQNGILLIFDEVMTFRLSPGGAQQLYAVIPDITALGKVIGGGLPIGAFGGREDIMKLFSPEEKSPVAHSGTFNGNAMTMAAGAAALKELTAETIKKINSLGDLFRKGFLQILKELKLDLQITGMGSLLNIHFSAEPVTDYRKSKLASARAKAAYAMFHLLLANKGIFIASRGLLCFSTPMSEEEMKTALNAAGEALSEMRPMLQKEFPHLVLK